MTIASGKPTTFTSPLIVLCCALLPYPLNAHAQENAKKPALDSDELFMQRFQGLPAKQKQSICNGDLETIFPECWQLIGPADVLRNAYRTQEPFAPPVLGALERNFPLTTSPDQRLAVAFVLYRYGRQAARNYLLQQTNGNKNQEAAIVLMINREEEALPAILTLLSHDREREMVRLAGQWKHPQIRTALVETFRTAVKNKESGTGVFLMPLAEQDATEAIPDITRFFNGIPLNQSSAHLTAAAALIRLKAPNRHQLIDYLTQLLFTNAPADAVRETLPPLQQDAQDSAKWEIIEALGNTGDPAAIKPLEKIIEHYFKSDDDIYLGEDADDLAVRAAHALVALKAVGALVSIEKLLVRLEERHSRCLNAALGRSLMALEPKMSEPFLVSFFNADWVKREKEKLSLKRLPDRYMPRDALFDAEFR